MASHLCPSQDAESIWRSRSHLASTPKHWKRGGLNRDSVIERLGAPKSTVKNVDGSREDYFEYYEGSASGWKAARGSFHLVADLFTLALWEIVATPTEYAVRGEKITARADFDNTDRMISFRVLGRDIKPLEKKPTAQPNAS